MAEAPIAPLGPAWNSTRSTRIALGEDGPPFHPCWSWASSMPDSAEGHPDLSRPWESLEAQLEQILAMQEEFRRSFDDQFRQLSALQSFTRAQARCEVGNGFAAQPRHQGDEAGTTQVTLQMAGADSVVHACSELPLGASISPTVSFAPDPRFEPLAGHVLSAQESARPHFEEDYVSEAMTARTTSTPIVKLKDYSTTVMISESRRRGSVDVPRVRDGVLPWVRAVAVNTLHWRFFEPTMGFVILLNSINIGWAIDRELRNQETSVQAANEAVFLVIFILELCLRIFVHGFKTLKVLANIFDFLLIVFTTATMVVEPLLAMWGSDEVVKYLQQLMILRMLRLLRLARAVRLVQSFRSLWKLVQGLWQCFGTMMSAMLLMFISMYVFACFGAELITKQLVGDPEVGPIVAESFATLPKIILTLSQFIAMDSTASLYVPLINRSPALAIYFALLMITITIALMNLVTALLVEDAVSNAQMDEEMKGHYTRQRLKALEPAMRVLFRNIDVNNDGFVQIEEVVSAVRNGTLRVPSELRDIINPARMLDLFEAIDADQSGDLSENEMIAGLSCVALADVPLETMQILHFLRIIKKDLRRALELSERGGRRLATRSIPVSEYRSRASATPSSNPIPTEGGPP